MNRLEFITYNWSTTGHPVTHSSNKIPGLQEAPQVTPSRTRRTAMHRVQRSNSKLVISRPESDSQVTQVGIRGPAGTHEEEEEEGGNQLASQTHIGS